MLDALFYELLDDIDRIEHKDKGESFLASLARRYNLSHVTYLGINLPAKEERYALTTYSDKWVKHYASNNLIDCDPVVHHGFAGILPLDWNDMTRLDKSQREFMGRAREFGIGRQGLSFPIRGMHGELALFSINSHAGDREWRELKRECMRDFQTYAYHFHIHVMRLLGVPGHDDRPLTARERECLKWAAAGKTAWETGMILSISRTTVDFHLENARIKLGAVNKPHLVALAIRKGVI